nr:RAD51-associated protein 2 [Meriones unguiculatus]
MSLSRPAWPAKPAWPVFSEAPPEDPAAASPSSKRPRLKEPDGVSEAGWPPGWPLLVVPRLSEVEKAWEWSLRPFTAFLIPKSLGGSGSGGQRCGPGGQHGTFQTQSCWQSGISGRAGCSRAPGRFCEVGLQDREALGVWHGYQAGVSQAPPNTSRPDVQGVKQEPEELPVREKATILKEKNSVRQPGTPFLYVTFSEETKSTLHEIRDRCKVDSARTSEKKENNVSSSSLKIPKFQNQACLKSANHSYFGDNITIIFPVFPRDLNSNMSFVYLKERAKKKNDKIVAYVRDFTNIFCSQNRPDAKKQKLQDDKKNVFVENDFSDYESNHQSLTVDGKIDLINLNYYRHSSIECDVKDSKKSSTLTLEDANWKGTERNLDCYIPTRQEESQSWGYNRSNLKRKKQNCWKMKNFKIICENNIMLKTNIVSLPNNFDSFIRNGDDWDPEERCIFKCIVHLNYLKTLIKESHIYVYLTAILISSRPLESNTKSIAKKRKLFKLEHVFEKVKKQNISSLTITTQSFPIYKPYEDFPLLMDFDNMKGLSLTKELSYKNTSYPEQLLNVESCAYCSATHVKSDPLYIQDNCGHNEKYYESSMYNQDLDTERKWKDKTTHFIFKFKCEDVFNVRQLGTLLSQNTTYNNQMNAMEITQKLSSENLLGEKEEKIYDFILKKDVKVTKSASSCQAPKAVDIEEEEDSFLPMDRMSSVLSASLVSRSVTMEETKSVNQNNGTNKKEDGGILQEIELANSKHFYPKNDSTFYANHQLERDSNEENNECFQGLTVKCLSTETLPIAKDFEMKSKFDLVLEELRMFHEISKENEIPSTVETNNRKENYFVESNDVKVARMEIGKNLEMAEINKRDTPFPCDVKAGSNKHKRHEGLFNWKAIPTLEGQAVLNEYCCPRSKEESLHSTEEDYKKPLPKSPAFSPDECKKEKHSYILKKGSHLSHGISRIQPLKTCSRPIRVGLSRRARPKQLHPYLK